MKKRSISFLLSFLLVLSAIPVGAAAAFAEGGDEVKRVTAGYVDENGEKQEVENCIQLSSSFDVEEFSFEAGEWYIAKGAYTVTGRIENNAPADDPAHLILGYAGGLNAMQGIHNPEGKGLIIYTYSTAVPGILQATVPDTHIADAAIGGNAAEAQRSGDLTINGGIISATGGKDGGAGIGGGFQGACGNVVINGGTVTAVGGGSFGGAGIGGGAASEIAGGKITINGGTVTATGGEYGGAGIGGGYGGGFEKITINGGSVTATGGKLGGAGIGKGFPAENGETNGTILITGGTVTATGGKDSAGIGGSNNYPDEPGSKVDTITITGGEITAMGNNTAAIGGGRYCTDHGTAVLSDGIEILAGSSEADRYYHNHELYCLKRAPYAFVHPVPAYTVRHLQQNADGTGYEEAETETLYGHTGEETKAKFRTYDGFVPLSFEQQTVKADGTTEVEIRYDRLPAPVHEHTFASVWSSNDLTHWHASDCGHAVAADLAEHTFDGGVKNGDETVYTCTVCGYEKTETGDVTAKLLEEALAEKAGLEAQLAAKEAELDKLKDESETQSGMITELNAEIDSLNAKLDAAQKEIERLKALSGDPGTGDEENEDTACAKCGKVHADNFIGRIVCFFNRIGNFFRNLFG